MISTSTRTLYLLPGAVQHLALFAFLPQFLVQFRLDVPTNFRVLLTPRLGAIALWKGLGGCAWKGTADLETFINFLSSPHWQILAVDSVDVHLSLIFIVWFCQFCRSISVKGFFGNLVKSPGYLISMQLDKARNILLREKGLVTRAEKPPVNVSTSIGKIHQRDAKMTILCPSTISTWLVVWKICYFSIYNYWEESSQLTNIFQRGWNHQAATNRVSCVFHVATVAVRNGWKPGSLHCSNPTRREVAVSCDDMWWLLMM